MYILQTVYVNRQGVVEVEEFKTEKASAFDTAIKQAVASNYGVVYPNGMVYCPDGMMAPMDALALAKHGVWCFSPGLCAMAQGNVKFTNNAA